MNRKFASIAIACATLVALSPAAGTAGEFSGAVSVELRWFPNEPIDPAQFEDLNLSLSVEPTYYVEWDDGRQSFTLVPFLRLDQHDAERTHFDIREATWLMVGDGWELRTGVRKVFWGTTETFHLVDIINQTDLVEDIDEENSLGQPMVNLALIRDWGTLDFFLLPYFRERTFPDREGRLRFVLPVNGTLLRIDPERSDFESAAGEKHVDFAVRYSHFFGDFDIGLYHFWGTSRDPVFRLAMDTAGRPLLIPRYDIINQTGLDLQATKGAWLWKLEAIHRSGQDETFNAFVAGLEYTFFGIKGTAMDLGVLAEYLYDDRRDSFLAPFQDDISAGLRLVFNDIQSTSVLLTATVDRDSKATFLNLEAGRRLGESFTLNVIGRTFLNIPRDDPFFSFKDDDYIELELSYHF